MILLKQADVYAPEHLGIKDVLVCGGKIEAVGDNLEGGTGCEVIDAKGMRLTPGLIDRHVHVTGGGGEGSFHTRTPQVELSSILKAGITTVLGLLGTDDMSRSVENLLAKVKALKEEGITAYALCGAYGYPPVTLTGSVKKDIAFVDEIMGLKLALSDHRAPNISVDELIRLGSDVRTAGMIGGKPGFIVLHMGSGKKKLGPVFEALAETDIVCSSVNIGSTKSGINMDAVKLMGEVVRETAELTKDNMCMGDAKLVVFCNAPEDNPFMAGAFHGAGEPDCEIHVGVSGPGAVRAALAKLPKDAPMDEVAELVKRTAFKITRLGQLVANLASERLGVPAGIIDLSLAPTPAIGDSVANILEEMGLESCGCCGTTACLALLNDAVKKGGVMASNHVGGLSGAFIPVSEDDGMINAANCGSLTLEKLEAMTAVCSVGIDMVVIPGDTSAEVISGLIADEAAIGMVNSKTTAVRVIPAIGHKAGDVLDFGGLLGHAPIMPISRYSPAVMIHRGGRIPAPMQALKN